MNAVEELIGTGGDYDTIDDIHQWAYPSKYPNDIVSLDFMKGELQIVDIDGNVKETKKFKYTLV